VHQEKRGAFVELGAFEKNGHGYQGSGQHMKKGANFKGKGALHLEKRGKGTLQGTAGTCIMADWAAN
jgi:hypothetical protein